MLGNPRKVATSLRPWSRHIGKGGAGIQDVPRTAAELVASLVGQVGEDVEGVETLCQQYVDVIAHKYHSGATSTSDSRLARFQQVPLPPQRMCGPSQLALRRPLPTSPCATCAGAREPPTVPSIPQHSLQRLQAFRFVYRAADAHAAAGDGGAETAGRLTFFGA